MRIQKLLMFLMLSLTPTLAWAGGNTSGGGNPRKVQEGALRLLIENGGLKRAMLNYLDTLPVDQIEDVSVRESLKQMIQHGLASDIVNSRYVLASPQMQCHDAFDHTVSASTEVGGIGSDVCFDISKLAPALRSLSDEEAMVQLASLAFHEHTHHYQQFSKAKIKQNEDGANRVAGYILITAKYVQMPSLQWTRPDSGPAEFQLIQSQYKAIKAREQAFLAPAPADYKEYPGYQGKTDRGIIRLLPRGDYEGKLSIRGGGAYFSFARLTHEFGFGSNIALDGKLGGTKIRVVDAGECDFGNIVSIGQTPLEAVTLSHPALKYFLDFSVASGISEIRTQRLQSVSISANGYDYRDQITNIQVGDTYALRSINFDYSDLLIAFRIVRIDTDGSVILAWKKLKEFPVKACR